MFVDIHNHLLPGIDDGARDLEESLRMARRAVEGGTDTMVATPHRAWQTRGDAPTPWVREQVTRLQDALNAADIPLAVLPGVELQITPGLAEDLRNGTVSSLGNGNWALIEPPFDHIPGDALAHLQAVLEAGYRIVLAHPERSADIQRRLAFAEACAELGVVLQITTGSLLGRFGPRPQATAEAILARASEWPLVIASDMHDLQDRNPGMMAPARDAAAKFIGFSAAQDMVDARPRAIVQSLSLPSL